MHEINATVTIMIIKKMKLYNDMSYDHGVWSEGDSSVLLVLSLSTREHVFG